MREPLILAFDTSAAHCAAALLRGPVLLGTRAEPMTTGQAERLMPMLQEMLAGEGLGWRDLTAIGVGTGPGNFTGIRVSVAAARGLALSLAVPAIGVSGFDALIAGAEHRGPVLATIDARHGRIWAQITGAAPELIEAGPLADAELPSGWAGLDVIGHRAAEIAELTGGATLSPRHPTAEAIARTAAARVAATAPGQPRPRPVPLYLRAADAAPSSDPPPVLLP